MLTSIAAASYFFSALAFLLLSALLLTSWRGHPHGIALSVACVLTAVWSASVGYYALHAEASVLLTDTLEILRNAGWTFFLLLVLGHLRKTNHDASASNGFPIGAIAVLYVSLLAATIHTHLAPEFAYGAIAFMIDIVGRVAMAVMGMLLVEQLYRNTAQEARWGIKFACLGMGGLFAYDFYLYSDAMLFKQTSTEIWAARGAVNALTAPLIAISAARNPGWSTGIALSRTMLFHSAALFGAAIYLLSMAAAGYYLRLFGGTWGAVMQVAFLFGAGLLLFAILFSGSVRAWLKVFISKHFYRYRYDSRDEWLRFTRALSEEGPGLNERTVQAIAKLMESPAAMLFIRKEETGHCEPVTCWNMPENNRPVPLQSSLCQYLEHSQWVIDLQEYASRPEIYEGLVLPDWLRDLPNAWLVAPLMLGRQLFGFIVLARPRSGMKLNWEATDLLKIAGAQAASYLAQRESANALMVARQYESYTRMSTFIVHDLKNLISQLSLLLANAERHKGNAEFQSDMLETIDFSVQKMTLLLQKLSRGSSVERPGPVLLVDLLRQAIALKSAGDVKPALQAGDAELVVFADNTRLERVLGHLIQNAIEATSRNGQVLVRLLRQSDCAVVEVRDTGHGMSEAFIRERLFKPFESTKSAGMGIGAFESRAYIRELGGQIEVSSEPTVGTTFRVSLPLYRQEELSMASTA